MGGPSQDWWVDRLRTGGLAALATLACSYLAWQNIVTSRRLEHMRQIRQDERRGRINAEKELARVTSGMGRTKGKGEGRVKSEETFEMKGIGTVRNSCFVTLNGTPWQPHACASSRCRIELSDVQRKSSSSSLDGLNDFSHVWVLFVFDRNTQNRAGKVKAKINVPRADRTVGLFATRTPHRPNPVGLSLCRLVSVDVNKGVLVLAEVDLVEGTAVLDVKPFVHYYDTRPHSNVATWLADAQVVARMDVNFRPGVRGEMEAQGIPPTSLYHNEPQLLVELVKEVLAHDIRRRHIKGTASTHSVDLDCFRFAYSMDPVARKVDITAATLLAPG